MGCKTPTKTTNKMKNIFKILWAMAGMYGVLYILLATMTLIDLITL